MSRMYKKKRFCKTQKNYRFYRKSLVLLGKLLAKNVNQTNVLTKAGLCTYCLMQHVTEVE